MKRINVIAILSLTAAVLAMMTVPAMAYTIDGYLDDWGVDPGSDWHSETAIKEEVENWPSAGGNPGVEQCDVEALYIDEDENGQYLYFAIVTSTPELGFPHPYVSGQTIIPGDLALDLNGDGDYSTSDPSKMYGFEYGVKLTSFDYSSAGKGTPVQGPIGSVFKDPLWVKITTDFAQTNAKFSNMVQPPIGPIWTANADPFDPAHDIVYKEDDWMEGSTKNYVIEMRIPKSALGISENGGTANLLATQSCTNDIISEGFEYTQIPEFTTVAIPVGMIIGLFYFFSRKRKQ
jgi:hypothetical protein